MNTKPAPDTQETETKPEVSTVAPEVPPTSETKIPSAPVTETDALPVATEPSKLKMVLGVGLTLLILGFGYIILFTDIKLAEYVPFIDQTVATVNGVAIPMSEYENSYATVRASIEAQGGDPDSEGAQAVIKSQAMSQLVNAQLLVQAAEAGGYEADLNEIDTQIAQMEENFGGAEALQARLDELNLTDEMFRQDIIEQLMVTAYLEGETDITTTEVTDEEIERFYTNIQAQFGDEIPTIEELRNEIVADIQIQKQQAALGDIIAELRAAADIEIRI